MKFLINREDLGNRTTGYVVYNDCTKEFVGITEKQIVSILNTGEQVQGFILEEGGKLTLDKEGFHTTNYMVRTGVNTLRPAYELEAMSNLFYVVVGSANGKNGTMYEVVNSRYARVTITQAKLMGLLEFGAVQGGAYLDNGTVQVCKI